MQKVRLVIDDLQVQSFATNNGEASSRGTVRAHDAPTDAVECYTQYPNDSCVQTCEGACIPGPSADCSVDCWYTLDWNCQSDLDCMYTAGGRSPSDC